MGHVLLLCRKLVWLYIAQDSSEHGGRGRGEQTAMTDSLQLSAQRALSTERSVVIEFSVLEPVEDRCRIHLGKYDS